MDIESMIPIDYQLLDPDTLDNVIREIVIREGTDYGEAEVSFEDKYHQALTNLKNGKARLAFDPKNNFIDLVDSQHYVDIEITN